ncbi:MC045 [Molluscum contagiosum virus subtype 2]|uniref:MC045 n=2 Tax=Molluscum contagiosum virus TaxID=10279 RepID=A0A1S7DLN3_MCV2|nr:MC045 [Molluscum contagiosum virus subtype 2]QHW16434.1 MC045L [Molluscum contagiosum virus]AYO87682.1 MC045 [Molluscum contagiosum virus subtype 2]AYO87852.1 MC045 [Molluscum contagiosum virus subtype 2]AYO88022.1 MC045 [Molluscum contagiosum virus subtype 2]
MEKLYAGIFGVFMTTPEDDFEEFLDVVQAVLTDSPRAARRVPRAQRLLLFVLLAALLAAILLFLYLKLARRK